MTEDDAYSQVAAELTARDLKPGLWAKALADALGNENLAKSIYIKARAEQLLAECRAEQLKQSEVERAARVAAAKKSTISFAREAGFWLGIIVCALLSLVAAMAAEALFIEPGKQGVGQIVEAAVCLVVSVAFAVVAMDCYKRLRW